MPRAVLSPSDRMMKPIQTLMANSAMVQAQPLSVRGGAEQHEQHDDDQDADEGESPEAIQNMTSRQNGGL